LCGRGPGGEKKSKGRKKIGEGRSAPLGRKKKKRVLGEGQGGR